MIIQLQISQLFHGYVDMSGIELELKNIKICQDGMMKSLKDPLL